METSVAVLKQNEQILKIIIVLLYDWVEGTDGKIFGPRLWHEPRLYVPINKEGCILDDCFILTHPFSGRSCGLSV